LRNRNDIHLHHILQGSHASWKVLDFFLENSMTWKVLENHFSPEKSWKLKLKVLESPGKNILESHAFFYNCMYIETISSSEF